jgi:hypothetical protein
MVTRVSPCGLQGLHFRKTDSGDRKITDLPEGRRQILGPRHLVEQPGRESERHLVRVADAVLAHIPIGAKKFGQIQVGQAGIENRQIVLIAIGHVAVNHAGLQGLGALSL